MKRFKRLTGEGHLQPFRHRFLWRGTFGGRPPEALDWFMRRDGVESIAWTTREASNEANLAVPRGLESTTIRIAN